MKKIKSGGVTCPTCGLGLMRKVLRSVTTRVGHTDIVIHRIHVEECAQCGERMYGMDALRRIRSVRDSRKRHRAA